MNKEIRKQLIELARLKTTWSYTQLNQQLQLGYNFEIPSHREMIGDDLGEVSEYEFGKGRPLLSALIVHQDGREQGDGFYKLCEKLYGGDWKGLKSSHQFELDKIAECYSFWKDSENYKEFKNDNH